MSSSFDLDKLFSDSESQTNGHLEAESVHQPPPTQKDIFPTLASDFSQYAKNLASGYVDRDTSLIEQDISSLQEEYKRISLVGDKLKKDSRYEAENNYRQRNINLSPEVAEFHCLEDHIMLQKNLLENQIKRTQNSEAKQEILRSKCEQLNTYITNQETKITSLIAEVAKLAQDKISSEEQYNSENKQLRLQIATLNETVTSMEGKYNAREVTLKQAYESKVFALTQSFHEEEQNTKLTLKMHESNIKSIKYEFEQELAQAKAAKTSRELELERYISSLEDQIAEGKRLLEIRIDSCQQLQQEVYSLKDAQKNEEREYFEKQIGLRKSLNLEKLSLLEQKQRYEETSVSLQVTVQELQSRCRLLKDERDHAIAELDQKRLQTIQLTSSFEKQFEDDRAQLLSKLSKQEQAVHQLTMENAHVTEKLEQVLVEKKVLGERLGLELQTLQEEHTQKLLKIQQNHEHETSLLRETIENIKSAQVLEKDETLREASSWRDTINKTKEQLRNEISKLKENERVLQNQLVAVEAENAKLVAEAGIVDSHLKQVTTRCDETRSKYDQDFKLMTEKLQALELKCLGYVQSSQADAHYISDLQQEVKLARVATQDSIRKLSKCKKEIAHSQKSQQQSQDTIVELQQKIAGAQLEVKSAYEMIEKCRTEAEKKFHNWLLTEAEYMSTVSRLEQEIESLMEEKNVIPPANESLKCQNLSDMKDKEIRTLQTKLNDTQNQLHQTKIEYEQQQLSYEATVNAKFATILAKVENYSEAMSKLVGICKASKTKSSARKKEIHRLVNENAELRSRWDALNGEHISITHLYNQLRSGHEDQSHHQAGSPVCVDQKSYHWTNTNGSTNRSHSRLTNGLPSETNSFQGSDRSSSPSSTKSLTSDHIHLPVDVVKALNDTIDRLRSSMHSTGDHDHYDLILGSREKE